jgi:1,6-anhydro-N-acetylmuramate kinase
VGCAREGRKKGGGAPAVPTHEDRAAMARGQRRPMVTGVGALSAVSVVTAW